MGMPYNHSSYRRADPYQSAIRVYTLFASMLTSSFSIASELLELSVSEVDGEYRIWVLTVLDEQVDYLYDVITDYIH